jgi:hypothetical protein
VTQKGISADHGSAGRALARFASVRVHRPAHVMRNNGSAVSSMQPNLPYMGVLQVDSCKSLHGWSA